MSKNVTAIEEKSAFKLAEVLWSKMEQGLAPWQRTWEAGEAPGLPRNVTSDRNYRGGNAMYLMSLAITNGWSNSWISFLEVSKLNGSLQGQKGSKIEVPLIKKTKDKVTGEEEESLRGFRAATVFNVSQVSGIDFDGKNALPIDEGVQTVERMLDGLKNLGMGYVEPSEDSGCSYNSTTDVISMPERSAFINRYEYCAMLAHQMSRATMQEKRVEREPVSFAYEMVRSEIAATMLCSSLNLPRSQKHIDNNAAYMKAWLEEFADEKSMLLKAASEATAIHDYLMNLAFEQVDLQKAA